MEVIAYTPEHFSDIYIWGKGWGTDYTERRLPKQGAIVPGLAAYFIYAIPDCDVCFLENMISNPHAPKEEVRKALDMIVPFLRQMAKDLGYKKAITCSNNPTIIERAIRSGCNVEPKFAYITLEL